MTNTKEIYLTAEGLEEIKKEVKPSIRERLAQNVAKIQIEEAERKQLNKGKSCSSIIQFKNYTHWLGNKKYSNWIILVSKFHMEIMLVTLYQKFPPLSRRFIKLSENLQKEK